MKNAPIIFFSIVILALITSCNKDKDVKCSFTYDGSEYSLDKGCLLYEEQDTNHVNGYELDLFSPEVEMLTLLGAVIGYTGTGSAITLYLHSTAAPYPESRVYTCDSNRAAGTFDYASIMTNYSFDYFAGNQYGITSGTVSLSISTSKKDIKTYDVTLNCMTEEGNPVIGRYKGYLKYNNNYTYLYSGMQKSSGLKQLKK